MTPGHRADIYFTDKTWEELSAYVKAKYGERRMLSFVVEEAVKEYLARVEPKRR